MAEEAEPEVPQGRHLQSFNTPLNPDSVEFCPHKDFQEFFVIGNYKLDPEPEPRKHGSVILCSVAENVVSDENDEAESGSGAREQGPPGPRMKTLQTLETAAVFDLKWRGDACREEQPEPLLGEASEDGALHLYALEREENAARLVTVTSSEPHDAPFLSLDWSDRVRPEASPNLVASRSDFGFALFSLSEARLVQTRTWDQVHDVAEVWIAAFNSHDPNQVFTGADDAVFKGWDLRVDGTMPVFQNRSHGAGVCSLQSHPTQPHLLASGSYDDSVRLWDLRAMRRGPLSEVNVGGGAWRLKWHHADPGLLLVAGMYNGFFLLRTDPGGSELQIEREYKHHGSIAYGADWARAHQSLVACCSFYDSLVSLWTF